METAHDIPLWLLLVGAVGATLILTLGSIFSWLRDWVEAVHCPQCVGFWVGAIFGAFAGIGGLAGVFVMGCTVSVLSLMTEAILHRITRKTCCRPPVRARRVRRRRVSRPE